MNANDSNPIEFRLKLTANYQEFSWAQIDPITQTFPTDKAFFQFLDGLQADPEVYEIRWNFEGLGHGHYLDGAGRLKVELEKLQNS